LDTSVTLVPVRDRNVIQKISAVMFAAAPYSVSKYWSREMEAAIEKLISANSFDVVHFEQIHMAHYRKFCNRHPCLVDQQNVEHRILERCANMEKSLFKRRLFLAQARKMKAFEATQVAGFSACSAVSDEDGRVLMNLVRNKRPVYTLPNGVDTEFFRSRAHHICESPEEDALVFTGSMDWLPNADAASYFCKDILPLIWAVKPNVRFYIVGKGPSGRSNEFADVRIIQTGRVDDVRAFTARSKVVVVPLRIGGGTRVKILEAMSMERAIVSTSTGAEGIEYTVDTDIILADRPEVFARKVVLLLDDNEKRRALGMAGRKLVLEKYDWNIVGQKLNRIYGDILQCEA
jgi:glycosyltransferase involved in cell wall biosynthesis